MIILRKKKRVEGNGMVVGDYLDWGEFYFL